MTERPEKPPKLAKPPPKEKPSKQEKPKAYKVEAILKKRFELMKLDAETQMPSAFVVDYAAPADKKSKPIRWLIVVMSVASTLVFALLALLAAENLKDSSAA